MLDYRKDKLALLTAKVKIMTAGLVFGAIFVIFSGYLAKQYIGKPVEQRLSNLKQIVELGRNSIEPILVKYRSKQISKAQALEQVRNLVRRMVYEDELGKNYVFMSSYDGTMLVQPFEPQREMTNMWNLKDAYGVYIIRELIKTAESKNESGYVSYYYKRPNQSKPEEKISFVIGIPEMNCYIGTGKYMTDIRKAERTYIISIASLTFLLITLLAILVLSSMREVQRQNLMLQQENEALKQAEDALRESEEKYRTVLESNPDPVVVYDMEGRVIYLNPAFTRVFGWSFEEQIGKKIDNFVPEENWPETRMMINKVTVLGESFSGLETRRYTKEGNILDTSISGSCYRDHEGNVAASVINLRDITGQKRLEDQLQQAQKMEAIGTLAGGVAHDLNNILGGLVSYPELLLLQLPEDSPLRKSILTIQKSGEKAAAVVQDLLTLARRGVVITEVVNPNDIISEYLESPEHKKLQSYHPGIHIEIHLEKDALNILGSSTHLSKTVMNLISNAAEAMPEGGKLTVSTENRYIDRPIRGYDNVKEGDYVVLTVSDTGTGIAPDDLEKIFEPFYTKKKMGRSGTGLGMAVVWGTVKDHNGYIDVQSTEGKGTTFTLYFSATREKLSEDKSNLAIESYSGNGESILVIDDVEEQRNIASGMLKELGYSVVSVSSGEKAVEYLKTNKVDLLLLDMIMDPGMDGLDTYKKILKLHPEQKAIIASGFSETGRVKEVQNLGAGAYIRKPLLLEKIGIAVKKELEK